MDLAIISPDLFPFSSWRVVDYIGSDHYPILIELDFNFKTHKDNTLFWNFKKANWALFNKILSAELMKNPSTEDLENEWSYFKHSIFRAAKSSIPRGSHRKRKPAFAHDSETLKGLKAAIADKPESK